MTSSARDGGATSLRRLLDALYLWSGRLAACCLVAICVIVTAQVLGNAVDRILLAVAGWQIGIVIPAYADIAGFFLSAATFLAMAHTLATGDHIRVQLLLTRLPARWRKGFELWCCGVATLMASTATVYAVILVMESIEFGDTLPGMLAIPLAIPQSVMVLGLLILTIALVDSFCAVWRGRRPVYDKEVGEELLQGG